MASVNNAKSSTENARPTTGDECREDHDEPCAHRIPLSLMAPDGANFRDAEPRLQQLLLGVARRPEVPAGQRRPYARKVFEIRVGLLRAHAHA